MAKSDLHIDLTHMALVWLDCKATNRGVRGAEEIILDEGFVVDAAAICGLQHNVNKKFLGSAYETLLRSPASQISDDYSFIFETKVSRADFNNTFKNGNHIGDRLSAKANFSFIVTPKKMLSPEEVPSFWGLLEQSGQGLAIKKMPTFNQLPIGSLYEFAYRVLRGQKWHKFTMYGNCMYDEKIEKLKTQMASKK